MVPGPAKHTDALAPEPLVGHSHPALDRADHVLVEQRVPLLLALRELVQLLRRRAERVGAAALPRLLEGLDLLLAAQVRAVLEQRGVPVAAAVVDDRHE